MAAGWQRLPDGCWLLAGGCGFCLQANIVRMRLRLALCGRAAVGTQCARNVAESSLFITCPLRSTYISMRFLIQRLDMRIEIYHRRLAGICNCPHVCIAVFPCFRLSAYPRIRITAYPHIRTSAYAHMRISAYTDIAIVILLDRQN